MSKAPISLGFSQEKVRSWLLKAARRSHYVYLDHLFCTVFRFLFVEKYPRPLHATPSQRRLRYHHRCFASAREPSELDFESSLPARWKQDLPLLLEAVPPLCLRARGLTPASSPGNCLPDPISSPSLILHLDSLCGCSKSVIYTAWNRRKGDSEGGEKGKREEIM